jgi:hypothetical protein
MDGDYLEVSPLLLRIACSQLVAMALSVMIYCACALNGAPAFLAVLLAASVSVQPIALLLSINRQAYKRNKARGSLLDYFHRVFFYKAKGGSYLRALQNSEEYVEDPLLRERIASAGRTHLMGGEVQNEADLDVAVIGGGRSAVSEEIRRQKLMTNSKQAEVEESSQRYATFSMFISTILPSFLVFAFIANTILSQGGFGILLFSCILLLFIPLLYSLGNALMWRRLFA